MNGKHRWDKQLPHGVADLFFEGAAGKRQVERSLCQVFANWGYTEIIPPTFEYYESLATEAGGQLQEEMYRFFDREGRTLALRADLTIPTARIVGTKIFDQPLPQRFFYAANVFRYEEPQAGRWREFGQAGVELIGGVTQQADVEILALLIDSLRTLGLSGFRVDVGHMGFYKALIADLALREEDMALLTRTVERKDAVALQRLLDEPSLPATLRQAIAALPHLQGGPEMLREAASLAPNEAAAAALRELGAAHDALRDCGMSDCVRFDLSQLRGMEYYTGLLFQVYAPGVGFPICSGGRYDDLIGHFGPALPAIGFAVGVERMLLALNHGGSAAVTLSPDVVMAGEPWPHVFELAQAMRAAGLTVEVDIMGRVGADLVAYGRARGAQQVIEHRGDGRWRLHGLDASRELDRGKILEEMVEWRA